MRSSLRKPVATPVMCEPRWPSSSMRSSLAPSSSWQRAHGVGRAALAHVEDELLRLVDRRLDALGDRVADVGDLARRTDELAQTACAPRRWRRQCRGVRLDGVLACSEMKIEGSPTASSRP